MLYVAWMCIGALGAIATEQEDRSGRSLAGMFEKRCAG